VGAGQAAVGLEGLAPRLRPRLHLLYIYIYIYIYIHRQCFLHREVAQAPTAARRRPPPHFETPLHIVTPPHFETPLHILVHAQRHGACWSTPPPATRHGFLSGRGRGRAGGRAPRRGAGRARRDLARLCVDPAVHLLPDAQVLLPDPERRARKGGRWVSTA
jgi:hypothetical protein